MSNHNPCLQYLLYLLGYRMTRQKVNGIELGPVYIVDGTRTITSDTIIKITGDKIVLAKEPSSIGSIYVENTKYQLPLWILVEIYKPRYVIASLDSSMCNHGLNAWLYYMCGIPLNICQIDKLQYQPECRMVHGYRPIFYYVQHKGLDMLKNNLFRTFVVLERIDLNSSFTNQPMIRTNFKPYVEDNVRKEFGSLKCCRRPDCYRRRIDGKRLCSDCHIHVPNVVTAGCLLIRLGLCKDLQLLLMKYFIKAQVEKINIRKSF